MEALKIEKSRYTSGLDTVKITGLTEEELAGLKQMTNEEAREELVRMLDERNGNIGTCWACGYGIYSLWFDNEAAYMNIGNSCD